VTATGRLFQVCRPARNEPFDFVKVFDDDF